MFHLWCFHLQLVENTLANRSGNKREIGNLNNYNYNQFWMDGTSVFNAIKEFKVKNIFWILKANINRLQYKLQCKGILQQIDLKITIKGNMIKISIFAKVSSPNLVESSTSRIDNQKDVTHPDHYLCVPTTYLKAEATGKSHIRWGSMTYRVTVEHPQPLAFFRLFVHRGF